MRGYLKVGDRVWLRDSVSASSLEENFFQTRKSEYEYTGRCGRFYMFAKVVREEVNKNLRLSLRTYDLEDRYIGIRRRLD